MTPGTVSLRTVDLDNCHQEPIHTPGYVQSHGMLLALRPDGALSHASRNAFAAFASLPPLGQRLDSTEFWGCVQLREAMQGMLEDAVREHHVSPLAVEADLGGRLYDAVLHAHAGHVLVEFEQRNVDAQALASFAVLAHRSVSRLKGAPEIGLLLASLVQAVRDMTGFDRVMAYRFHADDSGEVVAETKADGLERYAGRRFPASDIPVQARRLYIVNTLRLIADVSGAQVPIDVLEPHAGPLDLSYSILRSVSPIHLEYLKNIGVAASMSVSIVIDGRLWGLIACHHRVPRTVPYAMRMACDVLAQVAAATIQNLLQQEVGARRTAAAELRQQLIELAARDKPSTGIPMALEKAGDALARVIAGDRVLLWHAGELLHGTMDAAAALALLQWLDLQPQDLIVLSDANALPEPLCSMLRPVCGVLAMRHDRANQGWIVLLRNEQAATITWSGPSDKVARVGPLGARLTPDGSMAEWEQDVRGRAMPWDQTDLALARQILEEVMLAATGRMAEMANARAQLLAILGHDLRGPLQALGMAAILLKKGSDQVSIGNRIAATTGRMGRLVEQVLDMSRLHSGLGLGLTMESMDVAELLADIVDETRLSYPSLKIGVESPVVLEALADRSRLSQVIMNLLSNAHQHGALGCPVDVHLRVAGGHVSLSVTNVASPIDEVMVRNIFDPIKRLSGATNPRNPNGLGLGLYIANEAMKGHQGSIVYRHDGTHVIFTVTWPLVRSDSDGRPPRH